jgi:tetratricopeptide (TPR) repeat protein
MDAMELSEETAFDWSMVAQCHEHAGNRDKALEAAERALELDAETFMALQTAARIFTERGDYHTAKLHIERSLSCVPDLSGGFVRFLQVFTRLLGALPWIGARIDREKSEWLERPESYFYEWKTWAHEYLEWYHVQFEGNDHELIH